jgi:hypothetical protein
MLSYRITRLAANTQYWFNVVVADAGGNRAAYEMLSLTTAPGDKPTMFKEIQEVQAFLNRIASEGRIDEDDPAPLHYPREEADLLEAAIAATQSVYDDPAATADEIDEAMDSLLAAVTRFESTMVPETGSDPTDSRRGGGGGCDVGMGFAGAGVALPLLLTRIRKNSDKWTIALVLAAVMALTLILSFAQTARADGEDTTPPAPAGWITRDSTVYATSLTLRWPTATDNLTPQAELKYYVYCSEAPDDVRTKAACGKSAGETLLNPGGTAGISSYTADELLADTQYWFNVVVEDAAGSGAAYGMAGMVTARSDKDVLKKTIERAGSVLNGAAIGEDPGPGQYPQDTADDLRAAIAEAQRLFDSLPDDPNEAQEEAIDDAIRTLLTVTARFEESLVTDPVQTPADPSRSGSGGCNAGFGVFGGFGGLSAAIFALTAKRKSR